MSWFFLLLAGCLEIVGVIAMKQFVLTSRKIFLLAIGFLFMLSLGSLSMAMQGIPMSVAYPIWTGIGAGGGVIVGIVVYKESKNFLKIFFLTLIIAASIALKAVMN